MTQNVLTLFRSLFAPPRHLILFVLALWLGLLLLEQRAARHRIFTDALNNLVFSSLIGYIVGGRLLFALANVSAFRGNALSIFAIDIDMFDPLGALVTALLVGFIYGQRQKLPLWSTLDALTLFFAILGIGLSLSHLAAGTAFGKPTTLPWGMELWNATRHPTQIYELIASLLIFGVIRFRKTTSLAGSDFLLFAAWTAGARLFLEAFRGDSTLIFGGVRLGQVIAWVVLALAFVAQESLKGEEKLQ
jgi:phosphatidylglycerol:prolipoprotein diacylglycerol transferase